MRNRTRACPIAGSADLSEFQTDHPTATSMYRRLNGTSLALNASRARATSIAPLPAAWGASAGVSIGPNTSCSCTCCNRRRASSIWPLAKAARAEFSRGNGEADVCRGLAPGLARCQPVAMVSSRARVAGAEPEPTACRHFPGAIVVAERAAAAAAVTALVVAGAAVRAAAARGASAAALAAALAAEAGAGARSVPFEPRAVLVAAGGFGSDFGGSDFTCSGLGGSGFDGSDFACSRLTASGFGGSALACWALACWDFPASDLAGSDSDLLRLGLGFCLLGPGAARLRHVLLDGSRWGRRRFDMPVSARWAGGVTASSAGGGSTPTAGVGGVIRGASGWGKGESRGNWWRLIGPAGAPLLPAAIGEVTRGGPKSCSRPALGATARAPGTVAPCPVFGRVPH